MKAQVQVSARQWAMHKQEVVSHLCASEICDGDRHLSPPIWDLQAEEDCSKNSHVHHVARHQTEEVHLERVRRDFTPAHSMSAYSARALIIRLIRGALGTAFLVAKSRL